MTTANAIDERRLSKLKWRCRRGLLENDLFIERFFKHHEADLSEAHALALEELMALSDNDLLDLLLSRKQPEGELLRNDVLAVLRLMRMPQSGVGVPGLASKSLDDHPLDFEERA